MEVIYLEEVRSAKLHHIKFLLSFQKESFLFSTLNLDFSSTRDDCEHIWLRLHWCTKNYQNAVNISHEIKICLMLGENFFSEWSHSFSRNVAKKFSSPICNVVCWRFFSHPGHGNSKSCFVGSWACFSSSKQFTSHPRGFFSTNHMDGSLQVFKLILSVIHFPTQRGSV